jgi:DNA-binding response OmpR family regulator
LVIDDDRAIVETIVAALHAEGYTVRSATSGAAGLRAIVDQPPALLLLDLSMIGLDGGDLLVYMRTVHRAVPVVLITGSPERAQALVDRYGVECVAKPFDLDTLLACVARYMRPDRAAGD